MIIDNEGAYGMGSELSELKVLTGSGELMENSFAEGAEPDSYENLSYAGGRSRRRPPSRRRSRRPSSRRSSRPSGRGSRRQSRLPPAPRRLNLRETQKQRISITPKDVLGEYRAARDARRAARGPRRRTGIRGVVDTVRRRRVRRKREKSDEGRVQAVAQRQARRTAPTSTRRRAQAPSDLPKEEGMSMNTKIAIGVGAVIALGIVGFLIFRAKK